MLVEIALIMFLPAIFFVPDSATAHTLFRKIGFRVAIVMLALVLAGYGIWGYVSGTSSASTLTHFVTPIYQLFVWAVSYFIFVRLMSRAPKDVTFNWDSGLFWDRFYAIGVLLAMVLIPINNAYSLKADGYGT